MTHQELREKFFKFYGERGHVRIGQAPLVPEHDTSVLFTTAGMHPLIPYLLGEQHPDGTRLMNIQRSLRTTDIDEVGDNTHNTVFEMLGHWSLGDYWKREAITWSYEFVTQELGFPKEKLAATIFGGDEAIGVGIDAEAKEIWESLGMTRIAPLKEDNWWGPVHSSGPCGPTTEIFVHVHQDECGADCLPGSATDDHWVEIWNNVFMGYNKNVYGTYEPLEQKNIDTGVGLERVLMTMNGLGSVYETDVIQPIVAAISANPLAHEQKDVRLVADHLKAAVFLIADGVLPSNKDRGYVLRRLIRRAVRTARKIPFTNWALAIEAVLGIYGSEYPHLEQNREDISDVFLAEQQRFEAQLTRAEGFLTRELAKHSNPSRDELVELAFLAYQSHALPAEFSFDMFRDAGLSIDRHGFDKAFTNRMSTHQNISRTGSERKFGGHGLILDTGELKAGTEQELERVVRMHSATHLLQAGLRAVLGDHVQQKGSDINADRLRFDFTHSAKLTPEEIAKVEAWVNDVVQQNLPMQYAEFPLEEAEKIGALHFFGHKYPDKVKIYFAGESLETAVSKEFCGGPHVSRTGLVGQVKILKEESVSAGTRRLKATVLN